MQNKYPRINYRNGKRFFFRFSLMQRVQHIILFSCVITLGLTGFPQRYYYEEWAEPLFTFMGGIEVAPLIHRTAGSILLCLFVFHTGYWMYLFYRNRLKPLIKEKRLTPGSFGKAFLAMEMMPNGKDGRDLVQMFKWLLYLSPNPPKYDRISWKEKFDYFAPYWGIPILGPAGVALWFRDEFSQVLPGWLLNAFYIMHTDEALLAGLFLFFVHWYNVHYSPEKFPLGTVFLTGYLSEADMIHEHYAEYVEAMTEAGLEHEIKPQGHH